MTAERVISYNEELASMVNFLDDEVNTSGNLC